VGTVLALAAPGLHDDRRPGKSSVAASPNVNDYGGVVGASLTLN
jgi:hypothetical protein